MAAAVILRGISGREEKTIEDNDNNVAIQDSIAQNGPIHLTAPPTQPKLVPAPAPAHTLPPNAPKPTSAPVLTAHAGAALLPSPLLTLTQDAHNQNGPIPKVTYSFKRYDEITGEYIDTLSN
jgi:hypothetical protein